MDRFCIVGPIEEQKRRLRELADIGVTQFNIYLMNGDEEDTLEVYGRDILPEFTDMQGPARPKAARKANTKQR